MTRFTVLRGSWVRGGELLQAELGPALLANGNGHRCCLGHCAISVGVKPGDLFGLGDPSDVVKENPDTREPLAAFWVEEPIEGGFPLVNWSNSELSNNAISINDNDSITDAQREAALTELFEHEGHVITFLGDHYAGGEITETAVRKLAAKRKRAAKRKSEVPA